MEGISCGQHAMKGTKRKLHTLDGGKSRNEDDKKPRGQQKQKKDKKQKQKRKKDKKQTQTRTQTQGGAAGEGIVTVWPQHVPAARSIFAEGFSIPDVGFQGTMMTYESNIVFVMRYMVDRDLVGCSWLTLPAGKWRQRPWQSGGRCTCGSAHPAAW